MSRPDTLFSDKYTFGGISGVIILCSVILLDEVLPYKYGGDMGAFIWVTSHFILNPIFCLIYIVLTIIKIFRLKSTTKKLLNLLPISLPIVYFYILFFFPFKWVEAMDALIGAGLGTPGSW